MKRAGLVGYATVVTLIVLGSIAVAAPSFRAALHAPAAASDTGATGSGHPGDATGPVGAPAPLAPGEGDGDGGAPDFSACEGLTGLDNAICRQEALLVVHPDNRGLQHSLARLIENKAEHEAKQPSKGEGSQDHPGGGNGGNPRASEGPTPKGQPAARAKIRARGSGHPKGRDEGAQVG